MKKIWSILMAAMILCLAVSVPSLAEGTPTLELRASASSVISFALAAACIFSSAPFASAWVIHSIMGGNVPYLLLIMCMLKSSSFNIFSYKTAFNGKFLT